MEVEIGDELLEFVVIVADRGRPSRPAGPRESRADGNGH
jgi:hypothetical protein